MTCFSEYESIEDHFNCTCKENYYLDDADKVCKKCPYKSCKTCTATECLTCYDDVNKKDPKTRCECIDNYYNDED